MSEYTRNIEITTTFHPDSNEKQTHVHTRTSNISVIEVLLFAFCSWEMLKPDEPWCDRKITLGRRCTSHHYGRIQKHNTVNVNKYNVHREAIKMTTPIVCVSRFVTCSRVCLLSKFGEFSSLELSLNATDCNWKGPALHFSSTFSKCYVEFVNKIYRFLEILCVIHYQRLPILNLFCFFTNIELISLALCLC